MDPKRILNVPEGADATTITKAFRKMALKYHPDRAGEGSKLKFQHVGAAYEMLMAELKKREQKMGWSLFGGSESSSSSSSFTGMSPEDEEWLRSKTREVEEEMGRGRDRDWERARAGSSSSSSKAWSSGATTGDSHDDDDSSVGVEEVVENCPICQAPCLVTEEFSASPLPVQQHSSIYDLVPPEYYPPPPPPSTPPPTFSPSRHSTPARRSRRAFFHARKRRHSIS